MINTGDNVIVQIFQCLCAVAPAGGRHLDTCPPLKLGEKLCFYLFIYLYIYLFICYYFIYLFNCLFIYYLSLLFYHSIYFDLFMDI